MYNNTEDEYKEAVKNEYERVKNGQYSSYLSAPTRSKLSKLCWEIYEGKKMNQTDLNIFNALLGLPFDINNKNGFKAQKNKFRPIETFYKGETNPLEMDKVDLAAVLVDYQPRPFSRFRTSDLSLDYKKNDSIDNPEPEVEDDDGEFIFQTPQGGFGIKEEPPRKISFIERLLRLLKKSKRTVFAILFTFGLTGTGTAIYLAFFEKDNMQWSKDHYEVVYKEGIEGNPNEIIDYDEHLLDFKKVSVCDTSTCFKPDGEAIVWYAKIGDKADFFNSNGNGRHPETKKSLRPITEYIKGKYKGDCPTK
ncbi:hypothetical protein SD960_10250 [Flavobacterium sp. MMLR14_040]|uniref:hypothetical protein n=1 Tax=Flavobacterium sp. MMLR14_040 TaxID=3093843 RepID=UPI00298F86C2|nr:hypothetical protein [Flavobacterium sp. MMLR14_040]MDW8850473.1 hypothetical protein [Flavobacterium sp. MMLR14_040]